MVAAAIRQPFCNLTPAPAHSTFKQPMPLSLMPPNGDDPGRNDTLVDADDAVFEPLGGPIAPLRAVSQKLVKAAADAHVSLSRPSSWFGLLSKRNRAPDRSPFDVVV
jgi:hypothetical protein